MALASVAQLVGALSHTPKACGFDSQSGHILGCGFYPQLEGMQEAADQCFSVSLSVSLPLSVSLSLSSSLRSMKISPWWKIKKQKFLPWLYQSGNHRKSSLQIQKLPSFEERYNHLSSNPELLLELISPVSSCS